MPKEPQPAAHEIYGLEGGDFCVFFHYPPRVENSLPLKNDGLEDDPFLLGPGNVSGAMLIFQGVFWRVGLFIWRGMEGDVMFLNCFLLMVSTWTHTLLAYLWANLTPLAGIFSRESSHFVAGKMAWKHLRFDSILFPDHHFELNIYADSLAKSLGWLYKSAWHALQSLHLRSRT